MTTQRKIAEKNGFTMIEVVVAMVIFSIALTGLVPLLKVLSRDLMPVRKVGAGGTYGFRSGSPARDGGVNGATFSPTPVFEQHVWYVTPSNNAWVRKLNADARLYPITINSTTPPAEFSAATSPFPLPATLIVQDDNEPGFATFISGTATPWVEYLAPGEPLALETDCRRQSALPAGSVLTSSATWNMTVAVSGWYSIQATWPDNATQVDDAVFTVSYLRGGNTFVVPTVASVNQTIVPDDVQDAGGRYWEQLNSTPVQLNKDDVVQVTLGDVRAVSADGTKYIVADGARIVQNDVEVVSVERSIGKADNLSDGSDVKAIVDVTVNSFQ